MRLESVDASDNIKKLLKLKAKEDCIWAAVKCDLFQTHIPFAGDDTRHFGTYEKPFRDTSYRINCIEGKSTQVYKLKKLTYLGVFEAKDTSDKVFVFTDCRDRDLRFSGYILPFECGFHTRFNNPPDISCDVFSMFDAKRNLDSELIAFTEEDGFKICRELNGTWRNDMRYINFAETGVYIKKTLKSMMKQLDDFMRSEYMVDPEVELKKDLNGRERF